MSNRQTKNFIKINNKTYNSQMIFREKYTDKTLDGDGNLFPFPKNGSFWTMSEEFIKRLNTIQILIETKKHKNQFFFTKNKNCILCDKKNIGTKMFYLEKFIWEDSMIHYIQYHNIKPDDNFIDFIFDIEQDKYFSINIKGNIINENNIYYLKFDKNQIMILDALMKHGGYTKKYYDVNNQNVVKYSEHAGFLEIKNKSIYEIIVSSNSLRIDNEDEEIYLPGDLNNAHKFMYIFHTHPPTPKPGGRAMSNDIIYEFPSIGDILIFKDFYNNGKTIGSLVICSEGLYNIRKLNNNAKKININENELYDEMTKVINNVNLESIKKFGYNFSRHTFYSKISQDKYFINKINNKLNKYSIHIDYFPRTYDGKGKWIIDDIYIPVYKKK